MDNVFSCLGRKNLDCNERSLFADLDIDESVTEIYIREIGHNEVNFIGRAQYGRVTCSLAFAQ
jgi:hypothetical protein